MAKNLPGPRTSRRMIFLVDQRQTSYVLRRSARRKTLMVRVNEEAEVEVLAPSVLPRASVEAFLREKSRWILKEQEQALRRKQGREKRFKAGARFLFLGRPYALRLEPTERSRARVSFGEDGWRICYPGDLPLEAKERLIQKKLTAWYRSEAREVLGGRIFHYSRRVGREPRKIGVHAQKRMWGCCHYHTQTIYLNWQLVMCPLPVIDYVVVHELCHLFEPNHSRRFWRRVADIMPDFSERRQWLRDHQNDVLLPT